MDKFIVSVLFVGVLLLGALTFKAYHGQQMLGAGGSGGGSTFFYNSATQATTTVGIYNWATVLAADSGRGYTALCDNATGGVSVNNPVYLAFGATTTDPYGFRLGSGECYEMTPDNMFYGTVYAIASTATTTLLRVTGSY